jgi:hypothetical protein
MTEKILRLRACLAQSAYLTNGIVSELESYGVRADVVLRSDKRPKTMITIYVRLGMEIRFSTSQSGTLRLRGQLLHSVSLYSVLDVMGIDQDVLDSVSDGVPWTRLKQIRDAFSLLIPMVWDRRRLI